MDPLCRATAPGARFLFRRLALTVAAGLLFGSSSYAATFGHSRIASGAGEPLVIIVPISGLSAQDIQSLSAQIAPAADWVQAGLVPPVALDGLHISVEAGVQPATRVLRVQSGQALEGTLADLLIDVHTASGQQRYQVTLLTGGPTRSPSPEPSTASSSGPSSASENAVGRSARRVPDITIAVRKGDYMFRIAQRHAVDGVTVYQMMMALQRANPDAFIEKNINLVRAGERLTMPGMDELLALSDHDARREFQAQAAAFAAYRARHGGKQGASLAQTDQSAATQGSVSQTESTVAAPAARGDHLRLSGGAAPQGADLTQGQAGSQTQAQNETQAQAQADTRTAQGKAVADAQSRVSQLEENVGHLSEALKAQGEAARSAVVGGAKDLSSSLADVAEAVSQASRDAAAQAGGDAGTAAAPGVAATNSAPNSISDSGASVASGSAPAPMSGASVAPDSAPAPTSGASVAPGSASAPTSGKSVVTEPSAASGQPTASRSSLAPEPSTASEPSAASGSSAAVSSSASSTLPSTSSAATDPLLQPISPKTEKTVSWLQEHLLWVMTGLLALIVLVIAWLLRRANTTRDDTYGGAQVTEAMVREKLRNIDLDLTPDAGEAQQRDG